VQNVLNEQTTDTQRFAVIYVRCFLALPTYIAVCLRWATTCVRTC